MGQVRGGAEKAVTEGWVRWGVCWWRVCASSDAVLAVLLVRADGCGVRPACPTAGFAGGRWC